MSTNFENVASAYATINGVHKKVNSIFETVDGIWVSRLSKKYTWQRYNVDTITTYYWDKYNAASSTSSPYSVQVSNTSGSETITWTSPKYPRNDPPKCNSSTGAWTNCTSGTWDGLDDGGDWVVRSTSKNYNCYYVTSFTQLTTTSFRITYSKLAKVVGTMETTIMPTKSKLRIFFIKKYLSFISFGTFNIE